MPVLGILQDKILDFEVLRFIDLSTIDANVLASGKNSFTLIAAGQTFSSVGQVRDQKALSRCWQVDGDTATIPDMKRATLQHDAPASTAISYAGYRFPPDVIGYAV